MYFQDRRYYACSIIIPAYASFAQTTDSRHLIPHPAVYAYYYDLYVIAGTVAFALHLSTISGMQQQKVRVPSVTIESTDHC